MDSLVIFEESWRRYGRKIAQSPVLVEPVITFPSANDVVENHFFFGDYGPVNGCFYLLSNDYSSWDALMVIILQQWCCNFCFLSPCWLATDGLALEKSDFSHHVFSLFYVINCLIHYVSFIAPSIQIYIMMKLHAKK